MRQTIIMLMSLFLLSSCAHVISKENLASQEKGVSFRSVRQNVEKYKGKTFILGGIIVHSKALEKDTLIEILQVPLDEFGNLTDMDYSEGRFIARFKEELDPIVFDEGRAITLFGTLTDQMQMNIAKDRPYSYPVIEVKEYYLWKSMEYSPYYYTPNWTLYPQMQNEPRWWYSPQP